MIISEYFVSGGIDWGYWTLFKKTRLKFVNDSQS